MTTPVVDLMLTLTELAYEVRKAHASKDPERIRKAEARYKQYREQALREGKMRV